MNNPSDSELINNDLDIVLSGKFANEYIIFDTIRGTLERYGIKLPAMQSTGESPSTTIFEFDGIEAYLFIATKKDVNGHYDAYAQIVDEDELEDMEDMDISTEPLPNHAHATSEFLRRNRHCSDDSGNSDEY